MKTKAELYEEIIKFARDTYCPVCDMYIECNIYGFDKLTIHAVSNLQYWEQNKADYGEPACFYKKNE